MHASAVGRSIADVWRAVAGRAAGMAGADAVRVSGGVLGIHVLEGDVASGVSHVAPDPVGTHKVGRLRSAHILISKYKLEFKNLAFLLVLRERSKGERVAG